MDNKIKICFVSSTAYPLFNPNYKSSFGGAEMQIYLISKELAKDNNFDVNIIVATNNGRGKEIYNKVKVYKAYNLKRNLLNFIKASFKLYFALKKIKPDIVIRRAGGGEVGVCALYCKLNKKKFIYSIAHDFDLNGVFSQGLKGKIFEYGFRRADIFIAQTGNQVSVFKKRHYESIDNLHLIKNSLKINKKSTYKKDAILWVGRSIDFKRPEIFIALAKEFPHEKFVMIMQKSNLKLWDKIYRQAKEVKNIELIERVEFNKIDEYFNKAKIFVNTSIDEGFPNTFLQAANAQTPILSLKVNPDNFITKYECGISCDDDFDKLKQGLKKIIQGKEYYNNLANNCLVYLNKNHNIKENIKKWKKVIYENIDHSSKISY